MKRFSSFLSMDDQLNEEERMLQMSILKNLIGGKPYIFRRDTELAPN